MISAWLPHYCQSVDASCRRRTEGFSLASDLIPKPEGSLHHFLKSGTAVSFKASSKQVEDDDDYYYYYLYVVTGIWEQQGQLTWESVGVIVELTNAKVCELTATMGYLTCGNNTPKIMFTRDDFPGDFSNIHLGSTTSLARFLLVEIAKCGVQCASRMNKSKPNVKTTRQMR